MTGGGERGARAGHRSLPPFNTLLPTFGLDGAEPAQLVRTSGGKLDGESTVGLSTSTGTALNCSTGILILMLHFVQTIWWHTCRETSIGCEPFIAIRNNVDCKHRYNG